MTGRGISGKGMDRSEGTIWRAGEVRRFHLEGAVEVRKYHLEERGVRGIHQKGTVVATC